MTKHKSKWTNGKPHTDIATLAYPLDFVSYRSRKHTFETFEEAEELLDWFAEYAKAPHDIMCNAPNKQKLGGALDERVDYDKRAKAPEERFLKNEADKARRYQIKQDAKAVEWRSQREFQLKLLTKTLREVAALCEAITTDVTAENYERIAELYAKLGAARQAAYNQHVAATASKMFATIS